MEPLLRDVIACDALNTLLVAGAGLDDQPTEWVLWSIRYKAIKAEIAAAQMGNLPTMPRS